MTETDENKCPECSGSGEVEMARTPEGRFTPIGPPQFIKCAECGGTGKRRHYSK
jgi:DnaJ-class molecular chaperone